MNSLEDLPELECWRLLRTSTLGRLAYVADSRVEIVPVNFLVERETIVFASTQGSKLRGLHTSPAAAFEVDEGSGDFLWSVIVHGAAKRIDSGPEIEASGIRAQRSLSPLDKWNYVRIVPESITGRRFMRPRPPVSKPGEQHSP